MTNIVQKEEIHIKEADAIQQSKENGEAKYLGLFTDSQGGWINKKLFRNGRLILNEIINLSKNSIVL